MHRTLPLLTLALAGLYTPAACHAQIRLPHALSDHAVLQRQQPIHVWGWATPGAVISASLQSGAGSPPAASGSGSLSAAGTASALADRTGAWSLYLPPREAGGPYTLTVSGDGPPVTVQDLLMGDVWLASGQSNMEFPLTGFPGAPMKDSAAEIAAANQPTLWLLRIDHRGSPFPLQDVASTWTTCTPATAKNFSAIAYFFGREISSREHVPIGLIDSTWGGTPGDSWVSLQTLAADPNLQPAFAARAEFAEDLAEGAAVRAANEREDAEAVRAGKPKPSHLWQPDETSYTPAGLFNGMIAPLRGLSLKGFLWYQGETNSGPGRAPYYAPLMRGLIRDWRMQFAQGELPFLYVQISSYESPGENWGLVRDAQRRALDVAQTAMAVTLDVGEANNVHPPDKQTVAARLSLAARALAYGEPVRFSGPSLRRVTPVHDPTTGRVTALRVWFDHGEGLHFQGTGQPDFQIAGPDHHFRPATARIEGNTVVVTSLQAVGSQAAGQQASGPQGASQQAPDPRFVRFGWTSVVTDSLYNQDGLPAGTFTSEPEPLPH